MMSASRKSPNSSKSLVESEGANMDNSKKTNPSSSCSSSNVSSRQRQQQRSYANSLRERREVGNANLYHAAGPLYSRDVWNDINRTDAEQYTSLNNLNVPVFTMNDWNNSPRLNASAAFQYDDVPEIHARPYANYLHQHRPLMWNDMQNISINDSMLPSRAVAPRNAMMIQSGSLQELFAKKPQATLFEYVYSSLFETMNDSKGRHIFEEVLLSCSLEQLGRIVSRIATNPRLLSDILVCKEGSKSMKKLIKVLHEKKSPWIYTVVIAISSIFPQLMTNHYGFSVIAECLNLLNNKTTQKLYDAFTRNWFELAKDEKGCIYLNEFINYSKHPNREPILGLISANSKFLSQDPSGNFVLEHVLGLQHPTYSKIICEQLRDLYIQLSKQKAGSHVVEKCLRSPGWLHVVIVLLKSDKLGDVVRDQFGNFVIQTALKETKRNGYETHLHHLQTKILLSRNEINHGNGGYGASVFALISKGIPLD